MTSPNAHSKLPHSKQHENALPGITPVPVSSGWVLCISRLLPHTVIIMFSSKAWRHHRVERQKAPSHQPPHHNWHGHSLGSCSIPSAARDSPEGTTSLRSCVHAQQMPEGGRFSSPSLRHTWLAQAPPNYQGAQIFLPGAVNPGHSPQLTAGWGGAGREGLWAPK